MSDAPSRRAQIRFAIRKLHMELRRQQEESLLELSGQLSHIIDQALTGKYQDEFFQWTVDDMSPSDLDVRFLHSVILELSDNFAEAMHVRGCQRPIIGVTCTGIIEIPRSNPYIGSWTPTYLKRSELETEIRSHIRHDRGYEEVAMVNQLLVGRLFRSLSHSWGQLALHNATTIWQTINNFVILLLSTLVTEKTSKKILAGVLKPKLDKMKQNFTERIGQLTEEFKKGKSLPTGKDFVSRVQNTVIEKRRLRTQSGICKAEFAASLVIDQAYNYYKNAKGDFVDKVRALVIEDCILTPLKHIFTSEAVKNMTSKALFSLAYDMSSNCESQCRKLHGLKRLYSALQSIDQISATHLKPAPMILSFQQDNCELLTPPKSSSEILDPKTSLPPKKPGKRKADDDGSHLFAHETKRRMQNSLPQILAIEDLPALTSTEASSPVNRAISLLR